MSLKELFAKVSEIADDDDDEDEEHPLGHELDRFAERDGDGIKGFLAGLGLWAKENPKKVLQVMRKVRPVFYLKHKNIAAVTAFDTVRDVLSRDKDFGVTYGPKMRILTGGQDFYLGVDDENVDAFTARLNMEMGFRRDEVEGTMIPLVARLANERLDALGASFDLVEDYLKPIPAQFAIDLFGLQDCDPMWLNKTTQILFEYLFVDIENNPIVAEEAKVASAEFRDLLDASIASGKAGPDTVIGRGQKLDAEGFAGCDPLCLRNNILGLIIGLVPTTAKSAAMAFDYGTQNKDMEAAFFAAHAAGDADAFNRYCRELTRLNPINPGLFRITKRDVNVYHNGKPRELKAGTLVMASTAVAMLDKTILDEPRAIKTDRPETHYLTYGYGLHACTGRYLNDLHISTMLSEALKRGAVDRVAGEDGNLSFEGRWPSSLKVEIK
jgi:cytochrome P450